MNKLMIPDQDMSEKKRKKRQETKEAIEKAMRNEGKRNIEEINNRKHNRDCWKFTWEIMRIVGLEASLSSVPVPSPDKWGGLVAARASDHKTFARTNMAS